MDRKEYQRNYGQLHKDESRDRQRKSRALKKSMTGFSGAERQQDRELVKGVFKEHKHKMPSDIVIHAVDYSEPNHHNRISLTNVVVSSCDIAILNKERTLVGLIKYCKVKDYLEETFYDDENIQQTLYAIPPEKIAWFNLYKSNSTLGTVLE
jgi:hypothetical protein